MGGYICGDKVDELDKLAQEREPYEIAQGVLNEAVEKQNEWMKIRAELKKNSSIFRLRTIP